MQRRPSFSLSLSLSPCFSLCLSLLLSCSLFSLSISLCLSPPLASFSFSLSLSMPVRPQGVGVLRSCLPASLSEHQSMGHLPNPLTHKGPHFVWSPCSYALLDLFIAACVSSPRDWAVSVGSHMQHDMRCFLSASTCKRTAPFVGNRWRHSPHLKNWR